jgi:hypothetical protein
MTYGDDRLATNERREAAREKSKALRDQHKKKERRNRFLIQGGIGAAIIVILVIVALVVVNSVRPETSGPLNMQSDGITLGKNFTATRTPAIAADGKPVPTTRDKNSSVVTIRVYVDYFCPVCDQFLSANSDQMTSWLKSGAATLEIHPVTILDHFSQGTRYSSRAANAAACVANYSPDDYWTFSQALFAKQPKQNTAGLTNPQIVATVRDAGVGNLANIRRCINTERFKTWVEDATNRAATGPLPDSNVKTVAGAPVVIVDGLQYLPSDWSDPGQLASFVVQAAGTSFKPGPSSTTPTPVPSPSTTP